MITQNNKPIAFFSGKLTSAKTRHSVTKIEPLAIVETLKELKGILWGHELKVYTDYRII
jgi:hypothetical protein